MIQAATTKRILGSVYVTLSVRRYDLFKSNCTGRRRSETSLSTARIDYPGNDEGGERLARVYIGKTRRSHDALDM